MSTTKPVSVGLQIQPSGPTKSMAAPRRTGIVKREMDFCFAHRLQHDTGACNNLHGHEARVTVGISGRVGTREEKNPGMLIPFAAVKTAMQAKVHDLLDHMTVLAVDDPLVEVFLNQPLLNNAGVESFFATARANINARGYHDTRGQNYTPLLAGVKLLLIAEDPTSENLAHLLWQLLSPEFYNGRIEQLRVTFQETRKCSAATGGMVVEHPLFPQTA